MAPSQDPVRPAESGPEGARGAPSPEGAAPWAPAGRAARGQTLSDTTSDALTPIECALERFFEQMAARSVPVLALRGARAAPRYRMGGDLDLASPGVFRDTVVRALERQFEAYGVHVIALHSTRHMDQFQLYAPCGPGRHHHLCIDLHTSETCYGVPFLTASELLRGRVTSRSPHRPAAAPGALLNFLTPYLSGGAVRDEYAGRLEVVLEKHPAQTRALLGRLVGTNLADGFCAALREPGYGTLARMARRFRRSLMVRAFARRPIESIRSFVGCALSARLVPLFRTRGLTIALLGTDGTGKTTVGEELHQELALSFRSTWNRTIKLRPGWLPQLGRFLGRKPTEEEFARPHRSKPSGVLGTWARATYYWIDYTLGYAFKVLPLRRRNTLILFDRWIDDWLVDPGRYRMRAGSRYVRWLVEHSPRPDVFLVTTATQRVVRARKQEIDARETLRQLNAYEAFAGATVDAFVVDTSHSIDRSVDAAVLAALVRSQGFVKAQATGQVAEAAGVTPEPRAPLPFDVHRQTEQAPEARA